MKRAYLFFAGVVLAGTMVSAAASDAPKADAAKTEATTPFFQPTESTTTGSVTIGGSSIAYEAHAGTLVVHAKGYDDAPADRRTRRSPARTRTPKPRCSTSPISRRARSRAAGRSRSSTMAARAPRRCGCIWAPSDPRRSSPTITRIRRPRPIRSSTMIRQPARCHRHGLHRCAGHRLRPHRRQGQGEGVLWRRPGRPCLRRIHQGVPDEVRSLEFAEISVRRKLWHAAFGRAVQHAAER